MLVPDADANNGSHAMPADSSGGAKTLTTTPKAYSLTGPLLMRWLSDKRRMQAARYDLPKYGVVARGRET